MMSLILRAHLFGAGRYHNADFSETGERNCTKFGGYTISNQRRFQYTFTFNFKYGFGPRVHQRRLESKIEEFFLHFSPPVKTTGGVAKMHLSRFQVQPNRPTQTLINFRCGTAARVERLKNLPARFSRGQYYSA